MRKILLATLVVVTAHPAYAQTAAKKDRIARTPFSVFEKRFARIVVIAEDAELRDGAKVVGTVRRGTFLRIHESEVVSYEVWWEGKDVRISSADAIPLDRGLDYYSGM